MPTFTHQSDFSADTRTSTRYSVTVQSDATGISYDVQPVMAMGQGGKSYWFEQARSAPVVEEPAPDVVLNFAECAAVVRFLFTDSLGAPLETSGGVVLAWRVDPPGPGGEPWLSPSAVRSCSAKSLKAVGSKNRVTRGSE